MTSRHSLISSDLSIIQARRDSEGLYSSPLPREELVLHSDQAAQGFTQLRHKTTQSRRQPSLLGPLPHCLLVLVGKRLLLISNLSLSSFSLYQCLLYSYHAPLRRASPPSPPTDAGDAVGWPQSHPFSWLNQSQHCCLSSHSKDFSPLTVASADFVLVYLYLCPKLGTTSRCDIASVA